MISFRMPLRIAIGIGVAGLAWQACRSNDSEEDSIIAALTGLQTAAFQDGVSGYAGTTDTGILESSPTTNGGTGSMATVDGDEPSGSSKDASLLMRWDLSSLTLAPGGTLSSATITLQITDPSSNTYGLYALKRAWSETSATWNQAQPGSAWQTAGALGEADRDPAPLGTLAPTANGSYVIALNAAGLARIKAWLDVPAQNFGIILSNTSNSNGVDVVTRESATVTSRPRLTVTYASTSVTDAAAPDVPAATGGSLATGGTPGGAQGGMGGGTGVAPPAVLYAAGDVGDCAETGDTATGNLLDGSTDPIALLGDIGYPNGTASDLATCFGQPWGRHKPRIHPAPGNHEYVTVGASAYYAYFGAAAGDPDKGYYSYEVGPWHVVALNSNCGDVACSAGSAQEQWLRQDLAAHPTACTLAYFHHPRFNSGHHGNATNMGAIWQALMEYSADVVLSGHEHGYQRWKPMNPGGTAVSNGLAEFVVGTGGTTLVAFSGAKPSNVVVRDATTPGVLKLTLRAKSYDWSFLPIVGKTFTDQGTASCH
jgi:hypothetical protein